MTHPAAHIGLWLVILLSAMLLPFLPGRHDPIAELVSAAATVAAFAGLLLVPIGLVWLISGRQYGSATAAVIAGGVVGAAAAVAAGASGSLAVAGVLVVMAATWLVRLRRRAGAARRTGTGLPRWVPVALIVVPLVSVALRITVVGSAASRGRDLAIANAAALISDIEQYRERTGAYPVALNSLWPDYPSGVIGIERYHYEPNAQAYNLYFRQPSADIATQEIVMYNPAGEQDFSSHDADLLELSPEGIRLQRGYFASHQLAQAGWKRFLFD